MMRWMVVGLCMWGLLGCAESHDVSRCEEDEDWIALPELSGEFADRVDVETIVGDYEAPRDSFDLGRARFTGEEEYLQLWSVESGEVLLVVSVEAHADFVVDGETGRYCTADPTMLSVPQPPWFEASHMRVGSDEVAMGMETIDPRVVATSVPTPDRALVRDDDGLGFTLTLDYQVRIPGCSSDACLSLARVRHHLRRVD